MRRLFGSSLLILAVACEPSSPSIADDVDDLLDATSEFAEFFCTCESNDEDACAEAANEVLGDETADCIEAVVHDDPASRDNMRCSTAAIREMLECYHAEGICPERVVSGGATNEDDGPESEDEPIAEGACGLAFEAALDDCGELPQDTQDALDECLLSRQETSPEDCSGDC